MKTMFRLTATVLLVTIGLGGCSRQRAPGDPGAGAGNQLPELPSFDVTNWTAKTELFMEYPTLVSGRPALFAVHLTRLDDFKPVAAGEASVEFTPESGVRPTVLMVPAPARPGAFRVEEMLPAPGRYRLTLLLEAPGLSDRHDLGTVTVFSDEQAARRETAPSRSDDPTAITYLKEQQWVSEFATAPVREREVRTSIRAPATVHPLAGGEAIVAAPAAGRLIADVLLSIGARVQRGQVLARLEPRLTAGVDRATLVAELAEAQATLEAARVEQQRAEQLLAARAVPARRVEDARRALKVAEARLQAAEARLAQRDETLRIGGGAAAGNAFALRAPIGGRLAEVMATLGASYDEGAPLFRIVRTDRVELEVQVPAVDAGVARQATGLSLELPGRPDPLVLEPEHVHDAGVIDSTTRALPLRMEIENPGEQLLIGQAGTAVLYSRDRLRLPVVPREAVLMEAGRPYVFVQIGGERFARRFIEIASRDADLVGVKSGVKPDERVVTRGAYDIQLASVASGLPTEGHVH
jgi:RND family efflux transporter MFP subunit